MSDSEVYPIIIGQRTETISGQDQSTQPQTNLTSYRRVPEQKAVYPVEKLSLETFMKKTMKSRPET